MLYRLNLVLHNPEIPSNTGNIIRLCHNTGASLHLIKPLGFNFQDKNLRRAQLDYIDDVNIKIHNSFDQFIDSEKPCSIWPDTSKLFILFRPTQVGALETTEVKLSCT